MATTTETIILDLDATGVERGAARAESALAGVGRAVAGAGQAGATGLRPMAEALAQVDRVSHATGGSLHGVAESMRALSRTTDPAQRRMLMLGTALGVAGGAAATTVYAFGQLASKLVENIRNVDDLASALNKSDKAALAPYIARIQTANRSLSELDGKSSAFALLMTAEFAPAVTTGADAVAYLERAVLGTGIAAAKSKDKIGAYLDKLNVTVGGRTLAEWLLSGVSPTAGSFVAGVNDLSAAERAARAAATGPGWRTEVPAEQLAAMLGMGPAPSGPPANPAKPRANTSSNRPAAPDAFGGAVFDMASLWTQGVAEDEKAALEARDRAAREFAAGVDAMREQYHRKELGRIAAEADAYAVAEEDKAATTSQALGAIAGLLGDFAAFQSDMMAQTSADNKASLREQFEAQKAVMLAQAIVGAAAAIVQGFAQLGPIGGAITAATTTLATGLQIARIASQEPSFHVGGTYAPDERFTYARTRDNELGAFFTSQAVDALGGRQAAQDVAQTGRTRNRDGDIYLILDGEQFKARQFAKPDPRLGHRRR